MRFLLVCAGGALGSGARYLITLWMGRVTGNAFPWGTLLVNVAGCFALAVVMQTLSTAPETRLALTAGVLGGFTTYSAFNHELTAQISEGMWLEALAYVALTVVASFAAGVLGATAGRLAGSH